MKQKTDKTIVISISSGIIGRNIIAVPNGVLFHAKKYFERVILVVSESVEEYYQGMYGDGQVVIKTVPDSISAEEKNTFIKKVFAFFYTHLLFGDNAKGLAWEGVYLAERPKDTWSGKLSYLIKWCIDTVFGHFTFIRLVLVPHLDSLIHRKKYFQSIFEEYGPSVVFVPNVEKWQDICLVREARQHGVLSVGMPGSWDHLPKRFRPLHPDKLLVNTYTQKLEATKFQSYNEKEIEVVGVPYYDAFSLSENILSREDFCKKVNLDHEKKIIFFSSEGIYAPDEGDVTDKLYKWITSKSLGKDSQLFIRPYPAQDSERKKYDFLSGKPGVYVDWIENRFNRPEGDSWYPSFEDIVHFMNCLHHADIVVNTYSSIAIEAAYFGKQAIWVNFDGYQNRPWDMSVKRFSKKVHLKNILETGGVQVVNSAEELKAAINAQFASDQVDPRVEVLRHKMCGPMDGRTGERVVDQLVASIKINENKAHS